MPLISLKKILQDAQKNRYAVGCFNAINLEMARGVIKAAEEEKSPVILCHAELHSKYTSLEKIAPILISEARNSEIPAAVLLDHGKSFSAIIRAMNLGFNAVMFDGSRLSFEENIKKTSEIVKIAKELNVSVEAELGHVSRPEGGGAEDDEDAAKTDDKSLHTDPEQAVEFVNRTDVDALAVAFGTAHGIYLSEPELDFKRLAAINGKIDIPLVMHGGSGLTENDFKRAIDKGICKVNYYSNMAYHTANIIEEKMGSSTEKVFYHDIMMWSIEAIKENVIKAIRNFGSNNQI